MTSCFNWSRLNKSETKQGIIRWNTCPRPIFGVFLDGSSSCLAAVLLPPLKFGILPLGCSLCPAVRAELSPSHPVCQAALPWPGGAAWEPSPCPPPSTAPQCCRQGRQPSSASAAAPAKDPNKWNQEGKGRPQGKAAAVRLGASL